MNRWMAIVVSGIVLVGCATSEFKLAEEMVRQQKFYNAIELYLSFVRDHPNHQRAPEALFEVGNIQQLMLSEYDKALSTFRALAASYPINSFTLSAQQRLAEIEKNHYANYQQAVIEYEKLLQASPNHPKAAEFQFEIARCYTLLHNYDQAALEYKKLITSYPNNPHKDDVLLQKANNGYIGGRYEEALQDYQTMIQTYPNSPQKIHAVFGLGNTYEEMDRFEEARQQYVSIQAQYPTPGVIDFRIRRLTEREKKKHATAAGAKIRK